MLLSLRIWCILQSYITSLLCWPIKFCTKIMPSYKKSHFLYGHFPDISIISGATADGCNAGEPSKSLVQMVSLVACDSCSQRSQKSTAFRKNSSPKIACQLQLEGLQKLCSTRGRVAAFGHVVPANTLSGCQALHSLLERKRERYISFV